VFSLSWRAALAAGLLLFMLVGSAVGDAGRSASSSTKPAERSAPYTSDGIGTPAAFDSSLSRGTFAPGGQHGVVSSHLPAAQENVQLVGKLEMKTPDAFKFVPDGPDPDDDPDNPNPDPSQPDVVPGQIADLAVYKNAAYMQSWSEGSCRRGGFFSVDISNPANPQQLAFVPALKETYHGEGAHVITLNTGPFQGDVLAVNNEPCGNEGVGGFDLYDVSDPANPKILVQGAGDQSPDDPADPNVDCTGAVLPFPEECAFADTTQDPAETPNSAHSIFIWQDGSGANARAFAVIVDNTEIHDVDIFDITDPRNPQFIADVDLVSLSFARDQDIIDNSANGDSIFHHDMVVKEVNGVQTMLVSYWDAGYIKLNVEDPTNPQIIGDSAFDQQDPLVVDPDTGQGFERPEGNGHQSEFSHDNRFVLAADEDFSHSRLPLFEITTGSNQGPYPAGEFGFTRPMLTLEDNVLNGPTVFGGYGCDADNDIPDATTGPTPGPEEESIVVLQRGPQADDADPSAPYDACTFQEKAENAAEKGWDAVIIGNHHAGAGDGADPDAHLCGSGTGADIIGVCLGHRALHLLFNSTPGYDDYPPGHLPAIGTVGESIATEAVFDGWGYTHLYRNAGNDLEAVDHFAIEEGIDERYATGFGDMSVHEFATDPTEYVAYSSYYAGGMRVFTFGDNGLTQTGKFIDQGGNNFWGVEVFTTPQGDRLFAGSDRDFGLYLFRYTGPGAAQKPACSDTTVLVAFRGSVDVPLACSDANGNPLNQSRLSNPEGGTVADRPPAGGWVYTHTGNRLGAAGSFTFKANDGAADSNTATASLVAVPRSGGRCFNPFTGSSRRDVIVGSPFGDRIRAVQGRDGVQGRAGADCLSGGAGGDRLSGENGNDRLFGGARGDRLFGGNGRDRLAGNAGRNRYNGGPGNDRISARNRNVDRIRCGSGRDRVSADARDRVAGDCEVVRR
jgi:Ca2+-binding RTX toxin-like protein